MRRIMSGLMTREAGKQLKYNPTVRESDIADIVAAWTGIPVTKVAGDEKEKLVNIESTLHEKVIGQDVAVSAIAKAIKLSRVGLRDDNKTIGSFLFTGPTGVGKTELTKVLAGLKVGTKEAMVRIDMSEFMERHSVAKLIGSPPGYVGFSEGGLLTEEIRRKPYSVVLFDEAEKAHPDIFNILLQILEDGRLTDAQGKLIDFRNTLFALWCVLVTIKLIASENGKKVDRSKEIEETEEALDEINKFKSSKIDEKILEIKKEANKNQTDKIDKTEDDNIDKTEDDNAMTQEELEETIILIKEVKYRTITHTSVRI